MELATLLIVLIIFGLISFVIERIWGVNPYKVFSAVGMITIVFFMIYIMWPVLTNSTDINSTLISIDRLTNWFVNFLPGAIIGDVVGIILSKLSGGGR